MNERITRKMIQNMFEAFAGLMSRSTEATVKADNARGWRWNIGAWTLNHNTCYGGYVIEQVITEGGGVTNPFGSSRRRASEMWYTLHFARNLLFIQKKGA